MITIETKNLQKKLWVSISHMVQSLTCWMANGAVFLERTSPYSVLTREASGNILPVVQPSRSVNN